MRRITWEGAASRDMDRIAEKDPRAVGAIVEFVYGVLAEHPERAGGPLVRELSWLHRATRGPYRILYTFDQEDVRIAHVDHRATAYRRR